MSRPETRPPSSLAGIDGGVQRGGVLADTASKVATRPDTDNPRAHGSESWLAARVAVRLVKKYGGSAAGAVALVRVDRYGAWVERDPQSEYAARRLVYWGTVLVALRRLTGLLYLKPVTLRDRRAREVA